MVPTLLRRRERGVGEGADVVGRALDGDEVGAEVAAGDELVALEPTPHLAAEPPLVEVGEPGAVVGEDVDDRVLLRERHEPVPVARAQHAHLLAGPQHVRSLGPAGAALRRR